MPTWKSKIAPYVEPTLNLAKKPGGSARFKREYEAALAAGLVRINIGAGSSHLPGWINSDVTWRGASYLDATIPWPVRPGSVDVIYADNVIEHVTLELGRLVFKNAFAALKPGGIFRLSTPDVERVARQYLENGELARMGIERNREKGRPLIYPVELLRVVYAEEQHYLGFCYDYHSLSSEMIAAGFEVQRVEANESEHPDLRNLEARLHPAEKATVLIIEGRKPA